MLHRPDSKSSLLAPRSDRTDPDRAPVCKLQKSACPISTSSPEKKSVAEIADGETLRPSVDLPYHLLAHLIQKIPTLWIGLLKTLD
jgi:hypothetical protein